MSHSFIIFFVVLYSRHKISLDMERLSPPIDSQRTGLSIRLGCLVEVKALGSWCLLPKCTQDNCPSRVFSHHFPWGFPVQRGLSRCQTDCQTELWHGIGFISTWQTTMLFWLDQLWVWLSCSCFLFSNFADISINIWHLNARVFTREKAKKVWQPLLFSFKQCLTHLINWNWHGKTLLWINPFTFPSSRSMSMKHSTTAWVRDLTDHV